MQSTAEYGIKCNVIHSHRFLRLNAACWVLRFNTGDGSMRVEVIGLSIGGREIRTWIALKQLGRFRAAWMPEHVRSQCVAVSKDEAVRLADALISQSST